MKERFRCPGCAADGQDLRNGSRGNSKNGQGRRKARVKIVSDASAETLNGLFVESTVASIRRSPSHGSNMDRARIAGDSRDRNKAAGGGDVVDILDGWRGDVSQPSRGLPRESVLVTYD